ncbi:MAG TPA: cyclic nucleotide-binding domain-containing protein, partial [Polyangiaceae bacterium]|nr:cyclic nucleotide-binding domain-containing protein [Polyangiaceae bacterium]
SLLGRSSLPSARELAELLRDGFFEAGTVLYEEGSASDQIYFIVRGKVSSSRQGGVVHEFGPGSVLGVIDMQQDRPHVRSAVALTDVEALVLSAEDRLELLEDSFEHTRGMIRMNAERLTDTGYAPDERGDPGPTLAPKPEPLLLIERVFTLRDTPAFRKASIQALVSLAPSAEELRLAAGELLFELGEAKQVFYVVVAGSVELEWPGLGRACFRAASLLGGGGAFADGLARQRARATTAAVVLRVREEDFYDVMEDHFELARSVLSYLAGEHDRRLIALEEAAQNSGARAD